MYAEQVSEMNSRNLYFYNLRHSIELSVGIKAMQMYAITYTLHSTQYVLVVKLYFLNKAYWQGWEFALCLLSSSLFRSCRSYKKSDVSESRLSLFI